MSLSNNLDSIQQRIQAACARAGRDPGTVTLLAVSKTHPPETIAAASALGLRVFGENKIQEARAKIPHCPGRIQWHFIGHLQSNKCREAVALFEMIQSVDSLALAQELDKRCEQAAKDMPVLLEVNVAGESSKFGYAPRLMLDELPRLNELARLEIQGLMTVPPWSPQAELARPHFRRLRELKEQCEQRLGAPLPHLSMGMSGDFEAAIAAGADAFLTGEISEPQTHYARETGVAFLACGHHASERYGVQAVGDHLAAHFGITHRFIDIDNPA